jgi:hypothetical protein
MKIIISNTEFDFNLGCKILKLKHDTCPFPQLEDFWNDIEPITFKEISQITNLESRRVAFLSYGLDKLVKEVNPVLMNSKTLNKTTTWVSDSGELITKKFKDTYELYKVEGKYFNEGIETRSWQRAEDCYYVKCKDTSTDREYLIWVDLKSVYRTNNPNKWDFAPEKVNAIQAIAWTIQTNIEEGNIEKIVRQGDCIMIKPIDTKDAAGTIRHLTEKEYKELLVAES